MHSFHYTFAVIFHSDLSTKHIANYIVIGWQLKQKRTLDVAHGFTFLAKFTNNSARRKPLILACSTVLPLTEPWLSLMFFIVKPQTDTEDMHRPIISHCFETCDAENMRYFPHAECGPTRIPPRNAMRAWEASGSPVALLMSQWNIGLFRLAEAL